MKDIKYLAGYKKYLLFLRLLPRLIKSNADAAAIDFSNIHSYIKMLQHEKIASFDGRYLVNTFGPWFPSRAFDNVIGRGYDHPTTTHISTTNRCHGRCSYCSANNLDQQDLSAKELIKIISMLQNLKVSVIGFTGGEPFLRDDLEEIVSSVDDRSSTILFTSGYGLTAQRAKQLKYAGLDTISVSLDHADKAENDKRRFKGSYDIGISAIRHALAAGLYTVSSVVVTEDTVDDLEAYILFAKRIGVHGIRILDRVPSGMCIKEPPLRAESRRKIIEVHKKVNADPNLPQLTTFSWFEGAEMVGCGAGGVHHMFIDTQGNLRPCDFIPINFGNVLERPLEEVYRIMRLFFSFPKEECFMKRHHEEVIESLGYKAVVGYGSITRLLDKANNAKVPELYKR